MNTYLKSIYVHNNYVNNNFLIDFTPPKGEKFKHLIITGENGSGKTTVLKSLNELLRNLKNDLDIIRYYFDLKGKTILNKEPSCELDFIEKNNKFAYVYIPTIKFTEIDNNNKDITLKNTLIEYNNNFEELVKEAKGAKETIKEDTKKISRYEKEILTIKNKFPVKTSSELHQLKREIAKFEELIKSKKEHIDVYEKKINSFKIKYENTTLSQFFLIYLLKLKDEQIYAIGDEETEKADALTKRFLDLEKAFQKLFEEPELKLKHRFNRGDRKFYFEYPDSRQTNFNQLSHGHNAVMTMLAEIMLNIEAYREDNPDDVNPKGIVVIDEIESHLHLSLQEKILPVLIQMFPNLQFIVTTHSPAVIASIDNVTIYDLSKQRTVNESLAGIPYNVLMKEHFGLKSDYSITVTEKLDRVIELMNKKNISKKEYEELEKTTTELQELSPKLALDIYLEIKKNKKND